MDEARKRDEEATAQAHEDEVDVASSHDEDEDADTDDLDYGEEDEEELRRLEDEIRRLELLEDCLDETSTDGTLSPRTPRTPRSALHAQVAAVKKKQKRDDRKKAKKAKKRKEEKKSEEGAGSSKRSNKKTKKSSSSSKTPRGSCVKRSAKNEGAESEAERTKATEDATSDVEGVPSEADVREARAVDEELKASGSVKVKVKEKEKGGSKKAKKGEASGDHSEKKKRAHVEDTDGRRRSVVANAPAGTTRGGSPSRGGLRIFRNFTSARELFSGEAKKKRSNIGALLEQQEQEWVAATPSSGAGSTVSIVDKRRLTTTESAPPRTIMDHLKVEDIRTKKERSASVSTTASKTEAKLKKLKKKFQEKNKELKDTLIAKEQERLEKELYAKRVGELEEALAKQQTDASHNEQLEGAIKLLQTNVEAEAQLLRQRLADEEEKETTRKALVDAVAAQVATVVKLRDEERSTWQQTVRDAVESAQEAKRRETALLEEKSALEVEGRQKDNLVDVLREQFAALRQENEQNLVTVGSLRKQLEQARNEQDEGPQGSSDAVVLNSWATERQRLQEEVESLRELLREGDEAHDRDIEQLRKSLTQRQRDADDMLLREQERSNRLEKALEEALAQQRTRTRHMEELTEELEQKEDHIVTLKDDIAELQIEIEELKESAAAAAAAAAAAVEASTTAAVRPSVDVDELLEKVVDGLTAKLTRYNPVDVVKTDDWSVVELVVKRLLDAQHHDHESEVDAMEKEWNKIEDEAVERERGLEAQVERLEKQVAKLECEKQAGGGGATDHERPRSLRARSGRSVGGDDDDDNDNGPASDWRQKAMSLEKELASVEAELKTTTSDLAACEEEKQTLLRAQRRLEREVERAKQDLEDLEEKSTILQKANRTLKADLERVRTDADDELTTLRRENRLLQRRLAEKATI